MSQVRKKIAPPLVGSDIILVIRPGQNVNQVLDCTYDQLVQALQQYFTSADGFVPETRTLTINGVTYDLSQDRSWTVGGTGAVDSVNGQTGVVVLALDDLSDVNTGTPTNGQFLQWNGTEWVPATISTTAIDGANSRRWTGLNTAVAPPPGSARLRAAGGVTTGDPSAVIDIRISRYDETNADMQSWFTALNNYRTANPGKAYVQITDSLDNSVFGIYQLGNMVYTSTIQDYWTIGLTYVSGSVNLFSGGSTITFSWVLFGADGTGGTGTVQQVDTSTGLTGGPITVTGTIQLNTKLAPADSLGGNAGKFLRVNSGETAVEYATVSSGGILHGTAAGTDTYTVTITGATAYADGDAYLIRFTNGNTTSATLNISDGVSFFGAVPLYRNNDGPLIGGDILDGAEMLCVYNSTTNRFQVIGTSPNTLLSYVTNDDTVTLTKGMAVFAFGGTGDRMTVQRASNLSDSTSAQTVGLVLSSSIAPNQKGLIMMQGLLDGLNILPTATWNDGDPVFLGDTPGSITPTKPYAPKHLVYLGVVTTANNGSAGRMYVKVQNGYELDELHNVQAQSPAYKDTLWYDNTVSPAQWKTGSIASIFSLADTNIFVGNASNTPTAVAVSGDATLANTGALTIANNAVTYAKMQAVSTTSRLLGSSDSTTPVQEITLGTNLSMTGTTLNATGGGITALTSDVTASGSGSVPATLKANLKVGSCGVTFDGGGQVVQNKTAYVQMPYNGTLGAWSMVADQGGACTITVYKGTYGAFPTSSAVYSTQPAIPATNITATNAGAYNPGMATVTAGDVLKFDISGVSTITWVNLSISITKT